MPRRTRLDFNGAFHYVHVHGVKSSTIFFDPSILTRTDVSRRLAPHVQQFELLMASVCAECAAFIIGYCLEPNSGSFLVERTGASLETFMRRLCSDYARYLRARRQTESSEVFRSRYTSQIIAPEYLPHALRRIHRSPVVSGFCRRSIDYPFSSERQYHGEKSRFPLAKHDVITDLDQKGYAGLKGYRTFMEQEDSSHMATLFAHGAPNDSRIIGRPVFVQQVRDLATHPSARPTRKQLIDGVAAQLGVTPAEVLGSTRTGVLGRALVAWHGLRSGAATLTEMGRWFSVTGATLGQGIRHYRLAKPELFGPGRTPKD